MFLMLKSPVQAVVAKERLALKYELDSLIGHVIITNAHAQLQRSAQSHLGPGISIYAHTYGPATLNSYSYSVHTSRPTT